MKNDQEYEIRCVEADGHDYCCATFKSREVAEYNQIKIRILQIIRDIRVVIDKQHNQKDRTNKGLDATISAVTDKASKDIAIKRIID